MYLGCSGVHPPSTLPPPSRRAHSPSPFSRMPEAVRPRVTHLRVRPAVHPAPAPFHPAPRPACAERAHRSLDPFSRVLSNMEVLQLLKETEAAADEEAGAGEEVDPTKPKSPGPVAKRISSIRYETRQYLEKSACAEQTGGHIEELLHKLSEIGALRHDADGRAPLLTRRGSPLTRQAR